jgi:CubicO group peptidase (beta-lactamase class C family)
MFFLRSPLARRIEIAIVILLTFSAALIACGTVPSSSDPVPQGDMAAVQRQLEAFIAQEMKAHKIAGLSIALVDDQRTLWSHGAGWADQAGKRPAGPDTLYRMGSVSKLFTDTAAMQLVAQGRLQLDARIEDALPAFRIKTRWGGAPITVRQLMTHHSGLPRDRLGGMWGDSPMDFRAAVQALANEYADGPPGRSLAYSNLGVTVVGAAVEQLGGTPFEAHMQRALLDPLGMHGASFSAAVPPSPVMARAYLKGELREEPALRDVPAGGLTASVNDMAKFIAMQFARGRNARGEVVLPEAQWAEMMRVQNADVALDAGFQVGIGWMFTTFGNDSVHGGGPVAHHAGATFFHRAQLILLPQQRLGVIVAANDGAAGPVVNRVAQRALALMLEAKTGLGQPQRVPGYSPSPRAWADADRRACEGDYLTPAGVVSVGLEGSRLRARWDGKTLDLLEGEDGRLGLRYRLGGLVRLSLGELDSIGVQCRNIGGRNVLVAHLDGQSLLVGDRMPLPAAPVPAAIAALAGRYVPVLAPGERAMIESVTVEVADGRLWAKPKAAEELGEETSPRLPLQVISDTQAVLLGPLADSGPVVTLRTSSDGRQAFDYSGWTFVKTGPR